MKTSRIEETRSQTGITHHTINPILHIHFYILKCSLVPPLRRVGGGAEESGDTAIQSVAERNAIIGS